MTLDSAFRSTWPRRSVMRYSFDQMLIVWPLSNSSGHSNSASVLCLSPVQCLERTWSARNKYTCPAVFFGCCVAAVDAFTFVTRGKTSALYGKGYDESIWIRAHTQVSFLGWNDKSFRMENGYHLDGETLSLSPICPFSQRGRPDALGCERRYLHFPTHVALYTTTTLLCVWGPLKVKHTAKVVTSRDPSAIVK